MGEDGELIEGSVLDEEISILASPKKRKIGPHEISRAEGTLVPFGDLNIIAVDLFRRQTELAVLAPFAVHETLSREFLEIVKVERADPVVFQAVVIKSVPQETLCLVPHSEAMSPKEEDKDFKRPKHLHPALPLKATVYANVGGERREFEGRNPLLCKGGVSPHLGKGGLSPPPYWVVLSVEEEPNMIFKECIVPMEHPVGTIRGLKKKSKMKGHVEAHTYVRAHTPLFLMRTCAHAIALDAFASATTKAYVLGSGLPSTYAFVCACAYASRAMAMCVRTHQEQQVQHL